MKKSPKRWLAALILALGFTNGTSAQEGPPVERGADLYIIVLREPRLGAVTEPEPDVTKTGGRQEAKWGTRRLVRLPAAAVEQLLKHEAVSYIQRVYTGDPESREPVAPKATAQSDAGGGDSAPPTWYSGEYRYDGAGNIRNIGAAASIYDDGKQTLNDSGQANSYGYDTAGRLVSETVNRGTAQTEKYAYDSFGNLISRQRNSDAAIVLNVNPGSNRMNGLEYDVAGNMSQLGIGSTWDRVIYDPFSQIRSRSADNNVFYLYTADDERIGTHDVVQNPTGQPSVNGRIDWTIRDFNGNVLSHFDSASAPATSGSPLVWAWDADYVYGDGQQMIAARREPAEGGTIHYHVDHLGTPRLLTNANATAVSQHDYFAFGIEATNYRQEMENWSHHGPEPKQFTGHEREFMTGTYVATPLALDYMHARYYNPQWGRFLSVDPVIGKGALRNPQMWNRYSYVANNPLRYVDPDGRLLQLSECAKSTTSSGCTGQYNLLLSTFGKQSADAAKHLSIGKNGIISITGMSGRAFAAKFGDMGRATNYLVSNRAATFTINTGRTEGGANFVARDGGGGDINVDVAAFKGGKMLGGVSVSATEALVHEMGHGVSTLIQGHAEAMNSAWGTSLLTKASPRNEAYATVFENAWRRATMGLGIPIRDGYFAPGDVRDPASPDFFP